MKFQQKNNAPFHVALKEFFFIDDNVWEAGSRSANEVWHLHHPHIVNPLAAISIESRRIFMYEWASGGNLREYWERVRKPELSQGLVLQVMIQLQGLADALCQLHHSNKRHGNLKPENIMRSQGPSIVGTLMLGDFGFANHHERNHRPTGDEVSLDGSQSFRADVWAMGCIMFEFMIWLLYGWDDLLYFHSSANENYGVYYEVWPTTGRPRLSRVVRKWIQAMEDDLMCNDANGTALGDLLQCIHQNMLVVDVNERGVSSVVVSLFDLCTYRYTGCRGDYGWIDRYCSSCRAE